MKFSIIICTKDRPFDLNRVLTSLTIQKIDFQEVLIVDGSDTPVKHIADKFQDKLPLKYWHLRPPGLTRQRNFGIAQLSSDAQWVGFLDDDLELENDCIANLNNFIVQNPTLKGVGLRINDQRSLGKNPIRELMLLDTFPGGKVTAAGAAAPIRPYTESIQTEWVYGGATFWQIEILNEYKFDEWFSGVGYCEDLDFSYRVSRKYSIAVCANAKCYHHHKEAAPAKMKSMGEWLVIAWWYFARVKNSFNVLFVCWGIFWMSLNNLLLGIIRRDVRRLNMFRGNLVGWKKIAFNQVQKSEGFQK